MTSSLTEATYDDPFAHLIPGGVLTVRTADVPLQICDELLDPFGFDTGSRTIEGDLLLRDLPLLGNVNATIVAVFKCGTKGYNDVTVIFQFRAQFELLGSQLPLLNGIVTYTSSTGSLIAQATFGKVEFVVNLEYNDQFILNSLDVRSLEPLTIEDLNMFPEIAKAVEQSGLTPLIADVELNGLLIQYQTSSDNGSITDKFRFTVQGGSKFLEFKAGFDLQFERLEVIADAAKTTQTSQSVQTTLATLETNQTVPSWQLVNATIICKVDSDGTSTNVVLSIPASGLCNSKTTTARIDLTPSASMPLTGPVSLFGNVNLTCTDPNEGLELASIERREMEHRMFTKRDYVPRYQRTAKRDTRELRFSGFSVELFAQDMPFKFFDSPEPVLVSGFVGFDSASKSFTFNGKTSLFETSIDFSRINSNFTKGENETLEELFDYAFAFNAVGPISLNSLPFSSALSAHVDTGPAKNLVIANVYAKYERVHFNDTTNMTYSENFSVGGSGLIEAPGMDSLGITIDVSAKRGEDGEWSGRVNAAIEAKLRNFVYVKTTGDIPFGCPVDQANVTAAATVLGWLGGIDGLSANVSLTGGIDAVVPCNGTSLDWNQTDFKLALKAASNLSIAILDEATDVLGDVSLHYDSTPRMLSLNGALSVGTTAKFTIDSIFNLRNNISGKMLEYLAFKAVLANFALEDIPIPSLIRSLRQAGGDSLVKGRFTGQFAIIYTSTPPEFENDTINDAFSISAAVQTKAFTADVFVGFTRFQTSLEDTPSRWYFENATIGINTTYGQLKIVADGDPCEGKELRMGARLIDVPMLSAPVDIFGRAKVKCNVTTTETDTSDETESEIVAMDLYANATLKFEVFNSEWTVATEVGYRSEGNDSSWSIKATVNKLYVRADINDANNYSLSIGAQDVGFADLPFGDEFQKKLKDVKALDALKFKAINVEYSKNNVSSITGRFIFSDKIKDGVQLDARLEARFSKNSTAKSAEWELEFIDLKTGLYLADIDTFLDLQFVYACPKTQVLGSFGGIFRNLPMGMPSFHLNGTLTIPCNRGKGGANMSAWELTAILPRLTVPDVSFLPRDFGIPAGTKLTYSAAREVFIINWPLGNIGNKVNGFFTISFGNGVKDPYGNTKQTTGGNDMGVRFSGKFESFVPGQPPTLSLQDVIRKFSDLAGTGDAGKLDMGGATGPKATLQTELDKVKFINPILDLDPAGGSINFRCGFELWGIKTAVLFTASKELTGWEFAFGFPIIIPQGAALRGMPSWLRNMVSFNGIQIESVFFGIASGGLTLPVPNDIGLKGISEAYIVSIPKGGLALHGKLALADTGDMAKIQNGTGELGSSLGKSMSLTFSITVSTKALTLDISFALSEPAGCSKTRARAQAVALAVNKLAPRSPMCTKSSMEYTGLIMRLAIKFDNPGISFGFLFDVRRNLGGEMMRFQGGIMLDLSSSGGTLEGFFIFDGKWQNPMGFTPNLIIHHIDLSLGIGLPELVPVKFGMGLIASLDGGKYGILRFEGGLQLDLKNLGSGDNAMYVNLTNFNLATVVYGFLPFFPPAAGEVMQTLGVDWAFVSINLAKGPITFLTGYTAQPGFFLDVVNLNIFNVVTVVKGHLAIATGDDPYFNGTLELKKVSIGGFLEVTRFTDTSSGPFAEMYMYPKDACGFTFDGRIMLFGAIEIGVFAEMRTRIASHSFEFKLKALLVLWDLAKVTLDIESFGDSPLNWFFTLRLELTVAYAGGIFAGLVDRTLGRLSRTFSASVEEWKAATSEWGKQERAKAQAKFDAAQRALRITRESWTGSINAAQNEVKNARNRVNRLWNEYHDHNGNCKWYRFWRCVAAGWVRGIAMIAEGVLAIVRAVLSGVQALANAAIDTASLALKAAEATFNVILAGIVAVINSILSIANAVLIFLAKQLESAASMINLQYLLVQDTISSKGQNEFAAMVKVAIGGGKLRTLELTWSYNFIRMLSEMWKILRVALGEIVGAFIRPFSGDLANKVADAIAGSTNMAKTSLLRIGTYGEDVVHSAQPFVEA